MAGNLRQMLNHRHGDFELREYHASLFNQAEVAIEVFGRDFAVGAGNRNALSDAGVDASVSRSR